MEQVVRVPLTEHNSAVRLRPATMGDVISTAVTNLNTIITSPEWSPPSAIYSNFNFSTWALPSFPAVPSGNQVGPIYQYNEDCEGLICYLTLKFQALQVHLLLWNTECLFCDWFKPISTWTFPSTTISGGRRRRRSGGKRRRMRRDLDSFTYHSMPYTAGVTTRHYDGYFYEKPLKPRKRRRRKKISRRILKINSPTVRSEKLGGILKLIKIGLQMLLKVVSVLSKK